jgi:hypothetical protein
MGKKGKKKSFWKKQLKPFVKNNNVLLAALGGAAAGISIAGILGTEKAKQIISSIEDNVKDFKTKVANEFEHVANGKHDKPEKQKERNKQHELTV